MHRGLCYSFLLSLSSALLIHDQDRQGPSQFLHSEICGTNAPSAALKDAHQRFSSSLQRVMTESPESLPTIEIETWFHVVSTSDQVNLVTNEMIASQYVYLQRAYANASISYNFMGVDRSINDTWARNGDDREMKRALRRGTYNSLNIYFQTDLQVSESTSNVNSRHTKHRIDGIISSRDSQSSPNLLGFCSLPDPKINSSSSFDDYITDGCNILAATMPGGSISHYNSGGTAIHEVGHWHGLLHTFQGESCASTNEGDYIADTPQQSVATEGCPAIKDSCPNLPGLDAIHNFMDYSSDDCYQSFTNDQAARMRNMWSSMREGK
ncbi:hypothetical protein BGW36DRAFT_305009 [Talaromyces proteolyticus]|uniref:Peptidase M43 pregnancy-associated plasma-A domain-containing protein n=1 Tax=Talaromyces proteolyticus TaxID=1131652 RepID=A0AAD4KK17_9EURO|nr:uncharacterized protein BGW36DRAFT_305009 [Talaromyces proteolyticus]KAH8691096.1 hypothetical protein BGW36DRAFT_305009 [Talaromyces proteolyticus]